MGTAQGFMPKPLPRVIPPFAGPLAGTALMLPVYHILEDRVKELIDPKVYEEQVGMMEFVLDKEAIVKGMDTYRLKS